MSKAIFRFCTFALGIVLGLDSFSVLAAGNPAKEQRRSAALLKLADFDSWLGQFKRASREQRKNLEGPGYQKAMARRDAVFELMKVAPEDLEHRALSYSDRKILPENIKQLTEEKMGGEGRLDLLLSLGENLQPLESRQVMRVGEKEYEVYSYGRNKTISAREHFKFQAVRLGDSLALSEVPLRRVEIAEAEDLKRKGKKSKTVCPVSKKDTSNPQDAQGGAVEYGNTLYTLCEGGHLELLADQLLALDTTVTLAAETPPVTALSSAWTMGNKTILYIRVNYPDDLSEPITYDSAMSVMSSVNQYMQQSSYGLLSFTPFVTPLITLPKTKAEYVSLGTSAILSDARKAAQAAGYDYTQYNLDAVRYNGGPGSFSGMAYIGARGVWLKTNSIGTTAHEFGHNVGAYHSNFWKTSDGTVTGTGVNEEYGDSFDVMGAAGSQGQFNSYWKARFGWIPATGYATITQVPDSPASSQVVRIESFDQKVAPGALPQALRVVYGKQLWIDFRQAFTSNSYLMNGVGLHWSPWSGSNGGTHLLDVTPGSSGGKSDSALVIGSSFSDPISGITLTPISKNNTIPATIDVRVDLAPTSSVIDRVAISPTSTSLSVGATRQFTAKVYDQFSVEITTATVDWQATCGTISATGLYQAPLLGGSCVVSASSSGKTASAKVTVYVPTLTKIYLSPNSVPTTVGKTIQFVANGYDQYGLKMSSALSPVWASGACGTITQSGYFTATAGGNCSVTATESGVTGTASVQVTDTSIVVGSVSISPASVTLAQGQTQQFSATVFDTAGVAVSGVAVSWTASCGTVSSAGLYQAPALNGSCQVTASAGGKSASSTISVYIPVVSQLVLSPSSVSLSVGKAQQFSVSAKDQMGKAMSLPSAPVWSSGACGTITQTGYFSATAVGTCDVMATYSSISVTASVQVTEPVVVVGSVSISPASVTLAQGQTQQFSATVLDTAGVAVSGVAVSWTASCGTVSSTGLYQAPALNGSCQVTASAGGKSAGSTVSVYIPVLSQLVISPSSVTLSVSKTQLFSVAARDQMGRSISLPSAPVWSSGACGTVTQSGYFTATAAGICNVTASVNSVESSAVVTVTTRKGKGAASKR